MKKYFQTPNKNKGELGEKRKRTEMNRSPDPNLSLPSRVDTTRPRLFVELSTSFYFSFYICRVFFVFLFSFLYLKKKAEIVFRFVRQTHLGNNHVLCVSIKMSRDDSSSIYMCNHRRPFVSGSVSWVFRVFFGCWINIDWPLRRHHALPIIDTASSHQIFKKYFEI